MVSVFLLLLDSMKVFERERERERVVERRFWLVRGSNLWRVVLVSIYREKKWEGEVRNRKSGEYTESGGQERKNYNVLGTKSK